MPHIGDTEGHSMQRATHLDRNNQRSPREDFRRGGSQNQKIDHHVGVLKVGDHDRFQY